MRPDAATELAPSERSHELSDAERALAEFLRAHPGGSREEFERHCAAHPALADELRRLYDSWMTVETLVEDVGAPSGWMARILRRFGDVDPGVILPSAAEGGQESDDELLQRISQGQRATPRYTRREQIARGGMGAIFKVWDNDLRRHLAMKVIRKLGLSPGQPDRETLSRFLEEAQVTGQLDHPSVVPVHELAVDDEGQVFFTMRLVRGRDLRKILPLVQQGAEGWSLTRALNVLLRACEAMAYAHSKRVIHRDLKPGNIMVGRFGEVYVMDWGLARVLTRDDSHDLRPDRRDGESTSAMLTTRIETDRALHRHGDTDEALLTLDGTVIGTPSYMPPEQGCGETERLGPHSDVYSLGAILYHLLTGTMPFVPPGRRVRPQLILAALIQGPPRPVRELAPDAPEELVAICEKAMAREPEERYASAVELAADIQAYLEHRPVTARHHSLREVARLAYERNRPVVLTAATAAAVLLVAVSVFVWQQYRKNRQLFAANVQLEETSAERDRTAAALSAQALLQQADELTITPGDVGRIRIWLERVAGVVGHAPELRAELDALVGEPERGEELGRALGDIARLEALVPRIRDWERTAASLLERLSGEDAAAWERARAAIAASPQYGGLDLQPQVGLCPLREDPNTGLWEFWPVASGERPVVQGWDDRRHALTADSGIVLVLLPAGSFVMGDGSGRTPRQGLLRVDEVPAFFLGKYEVTQGQWLRIMGSNDAMYAAGMMLPADMAIGYEPEPFTPVHPIESVDWYAAMRYARTLGLGLPREWHWEYACRAGTETHWFWGDEEQALEGMENLAGPEAVKVLDVPDIRGWNDGFAVHAPVGSFEANAFGLFDMHGNVGEWCSSLQDRNWWLAVDRDRPFYRGGSWNHSPGKAVSAYTFDRNARENFAYVGLRVWRQVDE